ncbi:MULTISPECIES: SUKH-4 family immunity protein [unclassified Streptomyces]|uniref:SUKH-4 family immunity protein n=1 Tax=Streptomyces sp. NBC_00119 TaxID=2975659 RepID=A0AAU1UAY0_9ACTN|nr:MULTISPECIES: SUKH-4 family immunity protein [unclassified Streptomyces]MCX4644947.1 SUKH-4 family immunity protein [Streptomyces sp. NBC_01446]MCX5326398.1 SUKH-4 family immunity protein [Streptomyces sp. NBC_00120]
MVTFAQAQERAEEWINGDVPGYQHREVRVREFELGFVVWAEDREGGPVSDGGRQRLVIARDSGDASLWPGLPVGEVIRRYEEEYGLPEASPEPADAPPERVDLNQTSFLLSPPEWLQEAADKLGIPDRRGDASSAGASSGAGSGTGSGSRPGSASGAGSGVSAPEPAAPAPASADAGSGATPWPASPAAPSGATPWAGTDTNADEEEDRSVAPPATVFAPPLVDEGDVPAPAAAPEAKTALMSGGSRLPRTAVAPAAIDGQAPAAPGTPPPGAPDAYGYPQGPGGQQTPPPGAPPNYGYPQGPGTPPPSNVPQAPGSSRGGVSQPPPPTYGYPQGPGRQQTPPQGAPDAYGYPQGPGAQQTPPPGGQGAPGRPLAPGAGDIADAATSKAQGPPRGARGGGATTPPPPGAPGTPGARPSGPGAPGTPAGGYVPTQLVSQLGPDGPEAPPAPGGTPPGGVHHAATMLADPSLGGPGAPKPPGPPGAPGAPQPPGPPGGTPPGGVHHAATMLAQPGPAGPGTPPPPAAPGVPGAPGAPGAPGGGVHHAATMLAGPGQAGPGMPPPPPPQAPGGMPMPPPMPGQQVPGGPPPASYGYPQPTGQPTVGPGYQAVLRYRAPDGSEQQLIRRSAPGTPHPEWQIFHELRGMNIPPDQVLELHTELESCELPGAYCARMIREQWPQARITSIAPYGRDHASRQQGMQQLIAHQGELHQVADGPARLAPVRAPLPPAQPMPPVPPEAIGHELAAAFGPGVFRFDQRAVSRQGVPDIVAHTLVVAGLPADFGPFFWAQAQPGRPVPTLAELAQERGAQPASDAGSYLVMGSDFGRAICVQYGTANIVAVPVEAGPGGAPVPPQFVNTGLPEFARSLAVLGRMWPLRFGLNQEQAGRWTVDFQAQLAAVDPAALASPEGWWSVLLEQMWDGLL